MDLSITCLLVLTAALFGITSVAEYANPPGLSLPLLRFGDRAELPSRVIPIVVWLFVAFAGLINLELQERQLIDYR